MTINTKYSSRLQKRNCGNYRKRKRTRWSDVNRKPEVNLKRAYLSLGTVKKRLFSILACGSQVADAVTDHHHGSFLFMIRYQCSLAASRTDTQLMESVTEHFKKWGRLLNVKVLKDWMQRPYSFVQFEVCQHFSSIPAEMRGLSLRVFCVTVVLSVLIVHRGRATSHGRSSEHCD
jgi:hypothetical protein